MVLQGILYGIIGVAVLSYIVLSIVSNKKSKKAVDKDRSKQKETLKQKEEEED